MVILTLLGIGVIVFSFRVISDVNIDSLRSQLLGITVITLLIGIVGQSLGIMQVLQILESAGEVRPSLISGGLKSTFIPFIYGLVWFLIGFGAWVYSKKSSVHKV